MIYLHSFLNIQSKMTNNKDDNNKDYHKKQTKPKYKLLNSSFQMQAFLKRLTCRLSVDTTTYPCSLNASSAGSMVDSSSSSSRSQREIYCSAHNYRWIFTALSWLSWLYLPAQVHTEPVGNSGGAQVCSSEATGKKQLSEAESLTFLSPKLVNWLCTYLLLCILLKLSVNIKGTDIYMCVYEMFCSWIEFTWHAVYRSFCDTRTVPRLHMVICWCSCKGANYTELHPSKCRTAVRPTDQTVLSLYFQ